MKRFLLHALAIMAVLALPAVVHAQRGGRGAGGGGAHAAHGGHGSYGHAHYGYGGGYGLYGFGYGYPYYGYGGYSYGLYDPLYNPTYPRIYYPAYATSAYEGAVQGAPEYGMPAPTAVLPKNRAQVRVIMPDAEATLLFDGNKTSSLGRVRLFDPPELEPGVSYAYKLTASWMQGGQPVTDARHVSVMGGQVTVVDFTRPAAAESVAPPATNKK